MFQNITKLFFAPTRQPANRNVLVLIFLRGGADGINMVVPYGDRFYFYARPTIRIHEPVFNDKRAGIDLDGYFALHPNLAALKPIYKDGMLAMVHAVGLPQPEYSHFKAQSNLVRCAPDASTSWVTRHLASKKSGNTSPLQSVGFGAVLPELLAGSDSSAVIQSLLDFRLDVRPPVYPIYQQALQAIYANPNTNPSLAGAAAEIQPVLDNLKKVNLYINGQGNYNSYPQTDFGKALVDAAQLIKANVGLEIACLVMDGWDMHAGEGPSGGVLAKQLDEFSQGLAAFSNDLGNQMQNTLVMTMSEFGRTHQENGSHGTDHGHGNVMFLMGGGITGGHIYGKWPTLAPTALTGTSNLAVTTDYRAVFAEVLTHHLGNTDLATVFPGYHPEPVGLFQSK